MKHQHREFARPAVEIGAQRIGAALFHRRRAQQVFNTVTAVIVLAAAWAFGNAGLALLLMILVSGVALGLAVHSLRVFGERYRMQERLAPVVASEDIRRLRHGSRAASRRVFAMLILAVVLVILTTVWATTGEARGWVVFACIIALGYLRSSTKALMSGMPASAELINAAQTQGCRIVMFRSFDAGPSRLTRNVLVPILAGYGRLEIVFDPTLGNVEEKGFLGEEAADLERIATVHHFNHEEWKSRVADLIAHADIAVIEATRLTPGVLWEFARCMRELPPWRVYAVVDLEGIGTTDVADHIASFYDGVAGEPDVPRDVRTRWFYLGPGAYQEETLAGDVHGKMLSIIGIESGLENPSSFGPGAKAWLA